MANYNKIILVGNLTRDPQLRFLSNEMAVCDFGIAVNHKYRTKTGEDREDVLFVDCSCFGKGGEVINQYCTKGKQLLVEGRLKFDSWEDKNGGGKRSKHTVVVDNFQFLGGRDGAPAGDGDDSEPATVPASRGPSSKPRRPTEPPFGDEEHFKKSDVPF